MLDLDTALYHQQLVPSTQTVFLHQNAAVLLYRQGSSKIWSLRMPQCMVCHGCPRSLMSKQQVLNWTPHLASLMNLSTWSLRFLAPRLQASHVQCEVHAGNDASQVGYDYNQIVHLRMSRMSVQPRFAVRGLSKGQL